MGLKTWYGRKGRGSGSADAAAAAAAAETFIAAAGLSSDVHKGAVRALAAGLAAQGLWGLLVAVYPFVGGTVRAHQFNLRDPRDLDAAYRLRFRNNPTHTGLGVDWDGTSQYATTFVTGLPLADLSLSYYARQPDTAGNDVCMGGYGGGFPGTYLQLSNNGPQSVFTAGEAAYAQGAAFEGGLITGSALGTGTNRVLYHNGAAVASASESRPTEVNQSPIALGAIYRADLAFASNFTNAGCGFAALGRGLTAAQAQALFTLVQAYQNRLGRAVGPGAVAGNYSTVPVQSGLIADFDPADAEASPNDGFVHSLPNAVGGAALTGSLTRGVNAAYFNGRPTLRADLNNSSYFDPYRLVTASETLPAVTLITVARRLGGPGNGMLWSLSASDLSTGSSYDLWNPDGRFGVNSFASDCAGATPSAAMMEAPFISTIQLESSNLAAYRFRYNGYTYPTADTGAPSNSHAVGSTLLLGRHAAGYPFAADVARVLVYNRLLTPEEIYRVEEYLQALYQVNAAEAFIAAAGLTDDTQKTAVRALVDDLVRGGVWDALVAVYPMVGGNAQAHKFNLKDPRDADDAFRISFGGSVTHSAQGAHPNGGGAGTRTYLYPFYQLGPTSAHLSYYSGSDEADPNTTYPVMMGSVGDNTYNGGFYLYARLTPADAWAHRMNTSGEDAIYRPGVASTGFHLATRTDANTSRQYHHGELIREAQVGVAYSPIAGEVGLFGIRRPDGGTANDERKICSFATIGLGLSPAYVGVLYSAIQNFQNALGRAFGPLSSTASHVQAFVNRVQADGGTVFDQAAIADAYAKAAEWDLPPTRTHWSSPQFGLKVVNGNVTKRYCLFGHDAPATAGHSPSPLLGAGPVKQIGSGTAQNADPQGFDIPAWTWTTAELTIHAIGALTKAGDNSGNYFYGPVVEMFNFGGQNSILLAYEQGGSYTYRLEGGAYSPGNFYQSTQAPAALGGQVAMYVRQDPSKPTGLPGYALGENGRIADGNLQFYNGGTPAPFATRDLAIGYRNGANVYHWIGTLNDILVTNKVIDDAGLAWLDARRSIYS